MTMAVYVDPTFSTEGIPVAQRGQWPYDRACHMTADTHEELEAMARKLHLQPRWIQHAGRDTEHYDLVPSKRALAVRLGAVELSQDDVMRLARERYAQRKAAAGGG